MIKKIIISESERAHILEMYDLVIDDILRPLEKLKECKFTIDRKYVLLEGRIYSCETGEQIPLNEGWSLSDILHTGADVLSAGMDFVIPGSGAVVDILNALSYIIEGQFKNEKERDSLYLMAAITFGFVILPGPLQAIVIPLKKAIKSGVGMTSKVVVDGLKIIGNSLNTLLVGIPTQVNSALKSPLAKNILGKWSNKISGFITKFTNRIKQLIGRIGKKNTTINYTDKLKQYIPSKYLTNKKEVAELSKRLKDLGNEVESIKSNFVKKYGDYEFTKQIQYYLYGRIDKKTLISKLKDVKNVNIKVKPIIGMGADHKIFASINPNIIFKAEQRPGEVDKWYELFKKNENIFPKVGKKVKVKDENGKLLDAVALEKLNTSRFSDFWDKIENIFNQTQKNLPPSQQHNLEFVLKNFKQNSKSKTDFENLIKLSANRPELKQSFDEFINIVNNLYKLTPNPDIRKFNFGYDNNGVLKSLDI